jgi:hypothetical protein
MPPREDLFADAERAGVDHSLLINNTMCSVRHEFDRKQPYPQMCARMLQTGTVVRWAQRHRCQKNFLFAHAGWFLLTPHA